MRLHLREEDCQIAVSKQGHCRCCRQQPVLLLSAMHCCCCLTHGTHACQLPRLCEGLQRRQLMLLLQQLLLLTRGLRGVLCPWPLPRTLLLRLN
jgi:hypothetical protein